jgi:hypothetical protein
MSGLLAERAKLVAVCFQASPNYKSTLFVADGKMVIPQPSFNLGTDSKQNVLI